MPFPSSSKDFDVHPPKRLERMIQDDSRASCYGKVTMEILDSVLARVEKI